ncbi:DUF4145 domain-containing protein [Paenarthrobacter sp. NPDC089989]|uniref:DUF4145 domain-containing protein n=1 Tax=unclassified Paenarthrobacter TaxID=2634190 RepID=UPI00381F888F
MTVIGVGNWVPDGYGSNTGFYESVFSCDECHRLNIGGTQGGDKPARPEDLSQNRNWWDRIDPTDWSPKYVQGQSFIHVPAHIAKAASEAHRCRSIDALMSAVLMARSVIEAVAKDHGIDSGNLVSKIDALNAKGLIDDFTAEVAHTIRVFGNEMAHGDFDIDIEAEEADGLLKFMDVILQAVYQAREELRKLKAAAEARKEARA